MIKITILILSLQTIQIKYRNYALTLKDTTTQILDQSRGQGRGKHHIMGLSVTFVCSTCDIYGEWHLNTTVTMATVTLTIAFQCCTVNVCDEL